MGHEKHTKKGYLKDKGYKPEGAGDEKTQDLKIAQDESTTKFQYGLEITKRPRPEVEHKKVRKPSAPKRFDPQLKKALVIRNILIVFGIIILIFSFGISYQNHIDLSGDRVSLEKIGYKFMVNLLDYEKLKLEFEYGYDAWDVNKFLVLTVEDIKEDLKPATQFLVEVYDLSTFPIKYNRTLENNLAWSSMELYSNPPEGAFKISTIVNILKSFAEVHLARFTVTVWR